MPRWRTMIEPAVTSWPSPALTPRRWPTLSRPFFELEPAFLCAISSTRPSSCPGPLRRGRLRRRRRRPWPASPWWSWWSPAALAAGFLARVGLGAPASWPSALAAAWPRPVVAGLGVALASAFFAAGFVGRRRLGASRRACGERGVLGGLAGGGLLEALALGLRARARPCARPPRRSRRRTDVGDPQDRELLAVALLDAARAFGRYLKLMSFRRGLAQDLGLTVASSTTGRPIAASSPSATSSTRSSVIVSPGSTSRSSTSSSVPTSTRYCFPPVSMTAYMDPQGC